MNGRRKLKARIIERYGTCAAFAEALGCSRANVYAVLSGKRSVSHTTVETWTEKLDINKRDIWYFFYE